KAIKTEEERYSHTTRVGVQQLDEAYVTLSTGKVLRFRDWRSHCASRPDDRDPQSLAGSASRTLTVQRAGVRVPEGFAGVIDGEDLFKLHDTYGLRPDFVRDIVRDYALSVDNYHYERMMERQRERARASWKGVAKKTVLPVYQRLSEERK